MVSRLTPAEVVEAAAWLIGPVAVALLVFWRLVARRDRRRAARFAEEQTRIDDQAREERLAMWREAQR